MADNYCSSCGSPIPDGQGRSCSMCYGDIAYGKDGYYRRYVEDSVNSLYDEQEDRDLHTRIVEDF